MTRSYHELRRLETFEERFEYLSLRSVVGESTFGFDRYINQNFYTSSMWRAVRHEVITRDLGCDLGIPGREVPDRIIIHHMNPMTPKEIIDGEAHILNPDFLISVSHATHNAIHYGDASLLPREFTPRRPGDTKLW
jgi:hypothetical protein